MRRFVTITTPIPTLEEVAKRHKISKARQKRILEIMRNPAPARVSARKKAATGSSDEHLRNGGGAAKDSVQSKNGRQAVVI